MVRVNCKICSREFTTKPYFLKRGQGVYCSNQCHYRDKTGQTVRCSICGKGIYRVDSKLARSKSGKYFCTKSCQTKWRNTQYIGKKHLSWVDGKHAYRSVLARHGIPKNCRRCGAGDLRVLAIHHLDQNRKNSELENLVWLCHNCHYLIHHNKVEKRKFMEVLV